MRNLLFFFFLLSSCIIQGQEYFADTRKIGMEEGLSHYKVHAFYPEKEGMWIATADGINFYNGYDWKYWKKETGHFKHKSFEYLQKDQNNCLWLFNTGENDAKSETQAIYILNPVNGLIQTFEEKLGASAPFQINAIQNFFEDSQHRLYFFANQQLWRYSRDTIFELIQVPPGFEPQSIFSDGTYVGKLNNKQVLVSTTGEVLHTSDYPLKEEPYYVLGDRQTFLLWQEGFPCLLYQLQADNTYKASTFPLQPFNGRNFHLNYFDEKRQQFWVYKEPYLHLTDIEGNVLYKNEIMPRIVNIDKNGNLWIGKFAITILRPQKKKFKRFLYNDQQKPNAESSFRCRGLMEKNGRLYVTTYSGTQLIDLTSGEHISYPNELDLGFVIIKDRKQHLWGAKRQVIQLDQSDQSILHTFTNKENESRLWSMFTDVDDKTWIGGRGLSFIENGEIQNFKQYNDFPELKDATVFSIFQDRNGVIWIGSNDGLFQLDPKKGIVAGYGMNRKGAFYLPTNKFQHIYQDAQGIYWLATEDSGLLRWDRLRGEVQQFGKKHGFLSNNIYSVYEYSDSYQGGDLWLSSFNGLIQFDKETKSVTIYNEEDGISDNEFNRISHHQTAEGHLFFGGQNGVTAFHPKDFLESPSNNEELDFTIKHISIPGLNELSETLADGSKIDLMNLDPGASAINLEMKISDLFWTDKIELHYTLHQLDQSGQVLHTSKEYVSTDNHIELFGMKPGGYRLNIKAIIRNGKQLGKTIQIPLHIATPFVQTRSFWIGMAFVLGMAFWAFLKFRMAYLSKRKAELEKLVKERTMQILKDKKTITSQAEQIAEMRDQLNRKDQLWLEQFQTIINERLEDPNLDLPSVIDDMDIGRSVFYEKVKALTKMTPNQYIQELRLVKAKEILEEGSVKTVKEVSYSIGMNHPNYFSKLFKERFGISPSTYFREQKN